MESIYWDPPIHGYHPQWGLTRPITSMTENLSRSVSSSQPACAPQPEAIDRQLRRLARQAQTPWLHEEVARRLAAKLGPIRIEPKRWLHWSAHLGGGSESVAEHYPNAQKWMVEPHAALADRMRASAAQHARRDWRTLWRKSAEEIFLEPVGRDVPWAGDGVDLLWANMTLHGSANLPDMMARWHQHLAVGGFLMCSGLGPDTARELRQLYQQMGWPRPTIDFVDMHDLGDELAKAGFTDPVMDMERLTLTWASPQAMLDEVRTWGGNVAWGRFAGLRTPRWRRQLIDAIQQHLGRPDGRVGLTLELIYGHAIKGAPRVKVEAETRFSVQDMKQMIRHSDKR